MFGESEIRVNRMTNVASYEHETWLQFQLSHMARLKTGLR